MDPCDQVHYSSLSEYDHRQTVILTLLKQTNRILTYAKLETHYYVGETGYSDHVYSTDGVEQHNQAS